MASAPPLPAGYTLDEPSFAGRDMFAEVQGLFPGANFSSGYRTPEYQDDMRRRGYNPAANSDHLDGGAFDIASVPNMTLGQAAARLRTEYPGAQVLYGDAGHRDHIHVSFPGYDGAPALGGAVDFGVTNPNRIPPLPEGFELDDPDTIDPDPDAEGIEIDLVGGFGGAENETAQQMYQRMLGDGHSPRRASELVARVFGDEPVVAGINAQSIDAGLHTAARQLNAFNRGIPDILGAPVDILNSGLALTGLPVSDRPLLGSEMIRDGMQALGWGLDTPEMAPRSNLERYTQATARALGQNSIPGLGLIGAGGRTVLGSMNAANNAFRTGTALRSGTAVVASTGSVAAGGRQLALEAGRRPGVALTTEVGASVGQGTLGEYARQTYPDSPLAQTLAETAGAFGGGGLSAIAALRSSPPTRAPQGTATADGSPNSIGLTDEPVRAAQGTSESPLVSDGVTAPQAMANSPEIPTIQAGIPPLPPGFTLDGPDLSQASRIADIAQTIRPEDVTALPSNRVGSLAEAEIANPPILDMQARSTDDMRLMNDPTEAIDIDDLDRNAPPLAAYEETPSRAGNIDLSRLETPEDIARALDTTQFAGGGFETARRGQISQEQTAALASDLNMTPDQLLARRPGQALNAEQALAARRILAQSADELVSMAANVRGGSDEQLATFRRAWIRHAAIQEQVSGATAEAGRTLAQFRMLADSREAPQRILKAAIEGGGGREGLENVAERIIDLQRDPARLNRFTRDAANPSIGDKVWSLWYNSILSGPFTHMRNLIGNSVNVMVNVSEHGIASILGKGRNLITGSNDRIVGREVSARLYGLIQGAIDGIGHAGRAFRDGEASDLTSKIELNQTTAFRGPASYILEGPSRALLAEDEWFKSLARVSEIRGSAYRQAASEGLTGEAMVRRAEELVENPTDEMMEAAGDYARELTFQEPLGDITEKIQRMRTIREGDPIGTQAARTAFRLTVPFIRTPVNLLRSAARRTPIGVFSNRNIADFRAGGARRDLAITRVSVGTGVTALMFQLASEGYLTGSGPQDWRQRIDQQATGWQRNSIRVGDQYQSYAGLDPFAITAGSIANMVENMDSYSDEEWAEMIPLMIFGVTENLTNQTWTSGLSDLLAAIRDPERSADYYVARQMSSVVPAVVRQFNSSTIDTARRDTRGDGSLTDRVSGTIQAAIPGLSDNLPQRHDVFGRPIRNEGALGPDAISPLFQRTADDDPVVQEVARLGAMIGPPQRSVGGRRLSAAEYQEYQRVSGQLILVEIRGAMTDPVWALMNDEERREEIGHIKRDARREAREMLFPDPPELSTNYSPDDAPALPLGYVVDQVD